MKPPSGLRRCEHPSMTEGIGQLCEAIAPEHVLGPEGDGGAGFGHPRRQGVHGRRAVEAERDGHARRLLAGPHVAQEDRAPGNLQHRMHDLLPVLGGQTELLLRAEGLDVEADGRGGICNCQIGRYAHGISFHCEPRRVAPAAFWTSGGKSDISCTWRTSMTSPSPAGQRDAHWTASAFDFTWISQYPPITSLASAKGPSVTLGFPRENETRVPIEGGWRPSSASSTPALVSASLYFVISATISALGMAPGSAFSYPWGIISIMNRIVVPPSTPATSGGPPDRHRAVRLPARHGPDDQEGLCPRRDRVGQRGIRRFVGHILLAGEEPHERPAPLRDVVADSPAQHRIAGLERVEDRALRDRTF